MIPKIVHYCWFGNKDKPQNIKKCINTWKKILYDYTFMEWNESNFNISYNQYTKDAYEAKKYAFVSDVARLKALYDYGGIYLDTDVMVYKKFDSILTEHCVFGFEEKNYIATSFMACEPHNKFIKEFLDYYSKSLYGDMKTNVVVLTELLVQCGLQRNNQKQILNNEISIYPQEFFSPYDYINCVMKKNKNTICAHLYYVSWAKKSEKFNRIIKMCLVRIIGIRNLNYIRTILRKDVK